MSNSIYGDFRGTYIASANATQVKASQAVLHSVIVGSAAVGSVSIYDALSGTTNLVAQVSLATPQTYTFDISLGNGLRVIPSGTSFVTVTYQ